MNSISISQGLQNKQITILNKNNLNKKVIVKSFRNINVTQSINSIPDTIGFNFNDFLEGSNHEDFYKYSRVKNYRIFCKYAQYTSIIQEDPTITTYSAFTSKRNLVRNEANTENDFIENKTLNKWADFKTSFLDTTQSDGNAFKPGYIFSRFKNLGFKVLLEADCVDSRFPLTSINGSYDNDWVGRFKIWHNYYILAYYLAYFYDISKFAFYNEPNRFMYSDEFLTRFITASDAVQTAISDVNDRFNKTLQVKIYAPVSAGGYNKYKGTYSSKQDFGQVVIQNRHKKIDGTFDSNWLNFHLYAFNKYTTNQYDVGSASGYYQDFYTTTSYINSDIPSNEYKPGLALTEFNVRITRYGDSNSNADPNDAIDYSSIAASLILFTKIGFKEIYLFKFCMSDSADGRNIPVDKTGNYYLELADPSNLKRIGGATSMAEVYRLYNKACNNDKNTVWYSDNMPLVISETLFNLVTKNSDGDIFIFLSNKSTNSTSIKFDLSSFGDIDERHYTIEKVTTKYNAQIESQNRIKAKKLVLDNIEPQSVMLITIYNTKNTQQNIYAITDSNLRDGTGNNNQLGYDKQELIVRSDGTQANRQVALFKFRLGSVNLNSLKNGILKLTASTISSNNLTQAHVYAVSQYWINKTNLEGVDKGVYYYNYYPTLRRNVGDGSGIPFNPIEVDHAHVKLLGQLQVNSNQFDAQYLDITDHLKSLKKGEEASFLIVQEHRWSDINFMDYYNQANPNDPLNHDEPPDTQADGIKIIGTINTDKNKKPTLQIISNNSPESVKVFILAGQSNMSGRSKTSDSQYIHDPIEKNILYFADGEYGWASDFSLQDVYTKYFTTLKPLSSPNAPYKGPDGYSDYLTDNPGFFGPEIGFSRRLIELGIKNFVIIKVAKSNTSLYFDWYPIVDKTSVISPGQAHEGKYKGWLFEELQNTTKDALKDLNSLGIPYEYGGFFWHQGNSDTPTSNITMYKANGYYDRFKLLTDNVRGLTIDSIFPNNPNLPIIVGLVASYNTSGTQNIYATSGRNITRTGQNNLVNNINYGLSGVTSGLARSFDPDTFIPWQPGITYIDEDHYAASGMLQFGKRMANTYYSGVYQV
jgi:hypothetical protein